MEKVYKDISYVSTYPGLLSALRREKHVRVMIHYKSELQGQAIQAELRRQLFRESLDSGLPLFSVTFDSLHKTGMLTMTGQESYWYAFSLVEPNNQMLREQAKLIKFKEEEL